MSAKWKKDERGVVTMQEKAHWPQRTGNKTACPREKTIFQLFEEQAERMPDRTALVFEDRQLTYAELNERANRLARTLRAEGVQPDQPVCIMAERSLDLIVGLLGILKAGGAYVPIDPGYPEERIRYMLDDSGANLVLTRGRLPVLPYFSGKTIHLDAPQAYDSNGSNIGPAAGPNHLAYVLYTSGSTGKPKGVMVEHRSVIRLVKNCNYVALDETTRILQTGAVVFDASTFEIWGALLNGGRLYLVNNEVILNAAKLKEAIRRYEITTLWLTSPLFNQLSQQDSTLFGGLQTLLVGGDVLSVPHVNLVLRDNPGLAVVNAYGPTENTTFSTTHPIVGRQTEAVPIGRPISYSTAYVTDRSMKLLPIGAWGELLVGGGVARGYLNLPELTAEKFVESPFRPGERCYRTGDLVRWRADGTLEYKGRIDGQVKIRGYRIEPGEIESQLAKTEAVREAVVVAREDESGQKQLCAYFVADRAFTASEARSALAQKLPDYMIPSYFVQLEQIPLTINGKVDRKALPVPEESLHTGTEHAAPATELEAELAEIWREVLGVPNLSVLDGFYDLGGHSLKALALMTEMEKAGYYVTLTDIYHCNSIRALAVYLQSAKERERVIETKEELTAWLHREAGGVYELVSYLVRDFLHETKEIYVLYSDDAEEDRVERLVRMMTGKVAKTLLPHYIVPLHQKIEAEPHEAVEEEFFCRRLGLRRMGADEAEAIRGRLQDDYAQMDRWIKTGQVAHEYPLGAIQQMQIKFQTPPSLVFFKLDEYVDCTLLDRAYAWLVQNQGQLRSVPVQGEPCVCWKEYAFPSGRPPKLSLIDVSGLDPSGPFMDMLQDVVENTRYAGEHILYQMVVLKRNLREHYVIGVLHHVLCDRVTTEVIERQLVSCYRNLLQDQAPPLEEVKPFAAYVHQIQRGPQAIAEQELIPAFELETFQRSKRDILRRLAHRTSDEALLFNVNIPAKEHSLGAALSVYAKGLQTYLGTNHLPLLFLYDGRRYEDASYYNTIGEFIDFVPLLIDARWKQEETIRSVRTRLDLLKDHNINFMHLLTDPACRGSWDRIKELVQFGEQYEHLDLFMFNYLGNSTKGLSQQNVYDDTVVKQPNPLPIYSLFNCIAASHADGFMFSMRCSYKIDVEEVRAAFHEAACAEYQGESLPN
ncbi:amino acid adenylation domain-containing protein [Paenibacillus ehimensis]|uniref:Amino acid adenylation domain-containing protein n=1 Tax=Paenibacillus ehimensis TaxID=79264 RepID=A0ABT8V6T4_9BACL|nr:amino acid adenylation domain-containing protein [Paenibacillus ehimensis]MDO3675426.1 amino acid adenylation domain-containing protein [Paenibacillus ehimensis]